jgi:hypothetical protein
MDNVNTEQILRYLEGEMTPEEKYRFEESLSQNKALADESQRLSMSIDAVKYLGVVESVRKVHGELKAEGSIKELQRGRVVSFGKMVRYGIAAAACILFVIAGIKAYQFYSLNPGNLYDQAYVDYQLSNTRGTEPPRSETETAYQQKNYGKVIALGKENKAPSASESFFTGLAHMQKNDFAAAIPHLKLTASSADTKKADAEFYLAMAFLRNGDYDQSISLMEKIKADPRHPYRERFNNKYIDKVRMLKWK